MSVLKFIYKNLDRFKTRFALVFLAGILDGLATFFVPVVLAEFTRSSFTPSDFQNLIRLVVIFYLASLFLQWTIRKWGEALFLFSSSAIGTIFLERIVLIVIKIVKTIRLITAIKTDSLAVK